MAKVPQYEEQAALRTSADFQLPSAAYQAASFDRLQTALGRWQSRAQDEAAAQGVETQQAQAVQAQAQAEPGTIAPAPEHLARPYREAFREKAQTIYTQQRALDASRTALQLRQEHHQNPDGFAQAWGAYVKGQEAALTATDPTQAVETRLALEAYGQEVYRGLAERAFAREVDAQQAEALEAFREQEAALVDAAKVSGLEADFYQGWFQMRETLDALVDSGLLSASEADKLGEESRRYLTTDFLTGRFRNSLSAQDIGGAEAVIESLREGKWFRYNRHGEALAKSLSAELAAFLRGAEEDEATSVTKALRDMRRMLDAQVSGLAVDEVAYLASAEYVLKHGKPEQQDQALERLRSLPVAQAVGGKVTQVPLGNIPAWLEALQSSRLELDDTARNALEQELRRHQADLLTGLVDRDLIPQTQELERLEEGTPERLAERQRASAHLYGVPVEAVPLWKRAEERRFAQSIDADLKDQRFDSADALLSTFVAGYGGDLRGVATGALALRDDAPAVFLPALLHALGEGGDLTTDALALAGVGRRVDAAPLMERFGAHPSDLRRDRELARRVAAASFGDPALGEDIFSFLEDVYVGQLAENMQRGGNAADARREVLRLTEPFARSVEFANGARLPAKLVAGDERSARAVVAEVNRYLENPRLFDAGFDFTFSEDFARNLSVRPAPEGGLGFWHTSQGRFLTNRDGDIVAVSPPEPEAVPGPESEGLAGSISAALQWATEAADTPRQRLGATSLRVAGKALGASEPLLEGIYYAIQDTPPEERGWRPALGLPEDIDRQTDWSEILPLVRSETRAAEEQAGLVPSTRWESVSNASARPYVAAQHLRRMQKAFPDDEKAQLAAYFDSPELVRELQKQHGTLWYTELPLATQSFVARARRYAARRAP